MRDGAQGSLLPLTQGPAVPRPEAPMAGGGTQLQSLPWTPPHPVVEAETQTKAGGE